MRKALAVMGLVLLTLVVTAGTAQAKSSEDAFAAFIEEENVSRASNGDTIEVLFDGEFDAGSKTASGEGSFVDRAPDGTEVANGTFTATRLVAFQFYGCGFVGDQELPPDFCGGRALFEIHFHAHPADDPSVTIEGDGLMEINCQIGDTPPGTSEGTTIKAGRYGNFNEHVSGGNLFVQQ